VIAQGFCAPGERYIRICLRVWVITHWPMVIDCFLFRSVKHTHTHTHKHTTAEVFVCWLESGFSFCWISLLIIIWGLFGLENNQQKKKKDHLPPCCRWSILNSFFLFPFVRIRNRNKYETRSSTTFVSLYYEPKERWELKQLEITNCVVFPHKINRREK
jgi:hypothetical protein